MTYTATGAARRVSVVQAAGATPTSPVMKALGVTSFTLAESRDPINDPTLNGNRTSGKTRLGNRDVAGGAEFAYKPRATDVLFESLFRNTFTANVLKPAKADLPLFFEQVQTDAAIPYALQYSDVYPNTMSLDVTDGGVAKLNFGLVGRDFAYTTTLADAVPDAASQAAPFIHIDAAIQIDGVTCGYMTNFKLDLTNNLAANKVLGTKIARSITAGNIGVSGSFTVLAEDAVLMSRYLAETRGAFVVTVTNGDGKDIWTIPAMLITKFDAPLDKDGALTYSATFVGDPDANGDTIKLERVVA